MATTSSLLKSAASIRDQLATYQDSVMAYEYSNSAYTDSALSSYTAYLKSRIDALNATGSISGASKALSLTKSLDSATKQNISASIQRENIQMMSGNATLTDKYNVIRDQFSRAVANGDMTLAQSLESQAYSVSQSIQLQAQAAADAATTLGKANAASEGATVSSLDESLKQLNNDIKIAGTGDFNKTVKAWVDSNSKVLQSLGVKLPNQPNYWDVVQGIAGAKYNQDMLTAKAYAPYDPVKSQQYATDAYNITAGISTVSTLAGDKNYAELTQAAASPSQFVYNPSSGKMVQTQQTGHAFTPDGNGGLTLQPTYSGTVEHTVILSPDQTALMAKLGLDFGQNKNGTTGDGVQVQATNKSPAWIQNILGQNGVTNIFTTPEGLQFTYNSKSGTGLSTYTVIKDATGKLGIAEESNTGTHILNGEYGFNPMGGVSTQHSESFLGKLGLGMKSAASTFGGLLMGHASADGLLQNATSNYQLPPLPAAPPLTLPTLTPTPITPVPTLSTTPVPTTHSVAPPTVNPQPAAGNIQGGSAPLQGGGIQLQGGGFGLNTGGGGGLRL